MRIGSGLLQLIHLRPVLPEATWAPGRRHQPVVLDRFTEATGLAARRKQFLVILASSGGAPRSGN